MYLFQELDVAREEALGIGLQQGLERGLEQGRAEMQPIINRQAEENRRQADRINQQAEENRRQAEEIERLKAQIATLQTP